MVESDPKLMDFTDKLVKLGKSLRYISSSDS